VKTGINVARHIFRYLSYQMGRSELSGQTPPTVTPPRGGRRSSHGCGFLHARLPGALSVGGESASRVDRPAIKRIG